MQHVTCSRVLNWQEVACIGRHCVGISVLFKDHLLFHSQYFGLVVDYPNTPSIVPGMIVCRRRILCLV